MLDWIKQKLAQFLNATFLSKYIGSIVRTAFAALGGFLVAKGVIKDSAAVDQLAQPTIEIILGVVSWLIAQGASFAEKSKREEVKPDTDKAAA